METRRLIVEIMKGRVFWTETIQGGTEFTGIFKGHICKLRMNDFPDQPLYTLAIGNDQASFDDIPRTWTLGQKN